MKLKNYAYRCVAVVCAIVAVACVDEEFSMDKVSKEVSVLDGETILPLGSLEKQTLGSLLGSDTELPEGIVKNEDGSYAFHYELKEDKFSASDFELPTEFTIEAMESSFEIDLPTLDFDDYGTTIEESFDLELEVGFINDLLEYYPLDGDGNLPINSEMLESVVPNEEDRIFAFEVDEKIDIDEITFDLPEQLKNIKSILFDGEGMYAEGAPLSIQLDLNSFAGINAGGHFDFVLKSMAELVIYRDEVDVEGNTVQILSDSDGDGIQNPDADGYYVYNITEGNSAFSAGTESVGFSIYIYAIENKETEGRVVSINPSMEFDIDFELGIQAGTLSLTNGEINMPNVNVYSEFALKDAMVVFDNNVDLVSFEFGGDSGSEGFNITIDSLPEQVKEIEYIELSSDSKLVLYATNLAWLGDAVALDMKMPEYLVIKEGEGYTYNHEESLLTTTIEAISSENGLNVLFDKIDLSTLEKDENGAFSIELNPSGRVHFSDSNPISITEFIPAGKIDVAVGIKESSLGFEAVRAQLDFSESIEPQDIELGDLSSEELPIEIGGSGLSPVLMVTISNPLTFNANIEAQLMPYVGEEAQTERCFDFDATIYGAKKNETTGEVEPTTTTIVLAKESQRANYPAEQGYEFVEWNIDELISSLPDKLTLSATFSLPTDPITLHLGDISNLEVSYGASFTLPFAFDDQLSISYEDKIDILDDKGNSPFAGVADIKGLKIGDIALITQFKTTLPLELAVTTKLYNKAGEELPTRIGFVEGTNIIKGSADGETEEVSELRLQFDLADESGSLAELADIAAIGLKVEASSSAEEGVVALKEDQYISAELKLMIDGGVTVDLGAI
ncbi:MAG: hypothetical protein J6U73_01200 [Alistipes sp.]|nr:hypothetical protein [Alistipes sp.]